MILVARIGGPSGIEMADVPLRLDEVLDVEALCRLRQDLERIAQTRRQSAIDAAGMGLM